MKKLIAALLCLALLPALFGCGSREEAAPGPSAAAGVPAEQAPLQEEAEALPPSPSPKPVPPSPPAEDDYYRGTWINIPEQNVSDTLDHFYDSPYNYLSLSQSGRGCLVLGGIVRELCWTREEDSFELVFSDSGERCGGDIIDEIIWELDYMDSGRYMTFIKIEEDAENR